MALPKREEVKKHVSAIHISNKLTLLQRKLSNVLLLNAYDYLLSKESHSIDIKTLSAIIGFDSKNHAALRDALRVLVSTTLEWNLLNDAGVDKWGVCALLADAEIAGGVCTYSYPPSLKKHFYNPERYACINLSIQRKFTSGYALALYENCFRFYAPGQERSTGWIELELFKRLMGVDNNEYYSQFKELNRKVIKPAVDEINNSSNILVEPQFTREQRRVVSIRFLVRDNPQWSLVPEEADSAAIKQSPVYQRLLKRGISERLAVQWIQQHGEEYIADKLDYTDLQEESGRLTGTPSGFLVSAVERGFSTGTEQRKQHEQEDAARKQAEAAAKRREAQAKQREKLRQEFDRQRLEHYLEALPPDQFAGLQAAFLEAGKGNMAVMRAYKRGGFHNKIVQAQFYVFVKPRLPPVGEQEFEAFIAARRTG